VRPGMRRIQAEVAGPGADSVDAELFVSAYRDPPSRRVVTVLVNRAEQERRIELASPDAHAMRVYQTTNQPGMNLKRTGTLRAGEPFLMPARSLATLVSE
jgi:O-glycosyl hydrolase